MYHIGDNVIIKSRKELDEEKIKYKNAHIIDAWAGTLCVIASANLDYNHKYKYSLVLRDKDYTPISGWFWEEYELKPAKENNITISESDVENVLCLK